MCVRVAGEAELATCSQSLLLTVFESSNKTQRVHILLFQVFCVESMSGFVVGGTDDDIYKGSNLIVVVCYGARVS